MIKEYFANYYLHTCDVTFDLATASDGGAPARRPSRGRVTLVDTGEADA